MKEAYLVFEEKKWGPTEGPIHGAVNEYSEKIASGGLSHLFNAFVQSVIWVRKQNTDGLFDVQEKKLKAPRNEEGKLPAES